MRVIAGKAKGHRLKSPRGARARPTSDKVREAIFDLLGGVVNERCRVLDLYAGTGALGIEGLSRGAEWADFVEQDPRLCTLIRENLRLTGLSEKAKVYCLKVETALKVLQKRYGVIFLDPPYGDPSLGKVLEKLALTPLVWTETTVVVEHSPRHGLESVYARLHRVMSRHYGDSVISIYQ